jgi:hypothetical protein
MMTWGEFKAAVEAQGVQDGDPVEYIDISGFLPVYAHRVPPESGWEIGDCRTLAG